MSRGRRWIGTAAAVASAAAWAVMPGTAGAAAFTVRDTPGLVNAVAQANAQPGPDTIELDHPANFVYLPTSVLEVRDDLTITNPARRFGRIDGVAVQPFPSNLFEVAAGARLTVNDIAVTTAAVRGFSSEGRLRLERVSVSNSGEASVGVDGGEATIVNTTLASGRDFGIVTASPATIINSTIADNQNGGVDVSGGVTLRNTIVADNGTARNQCVGGEPLEVVSSISTDATCGATVVPSPRFAGRLLNNGGPSPTLALRADSPAVDAGSAADCPDVDQRGEPRSDGRCDIGAYELRSTDTTPPVLTVPGTQVAEATGPAGAAVAYPPATATDDVDGAVTPVCVPASGATFPLGDTTVTCTATDRAGNRAERTFVVTVRDTTGPVLAGVPSDLTRRSPDGQPVAVDFAMPTATDAVDGVRPVTCTPASGTRFALGDTTVTCTAADTRGTATSASFTVTVTRDADTTPPVVTPPADRTVRATGPGPAGTVVTYPAATAIDAVDGPLPATCTPPSGTAFPVGPTTVTCAATDAAGNTGTARFTVTVLPPDTEPPVITGAEDRVAEAAGPTGATVDFPLPTATDAVDGAVPVTCTPPPGALFALGATRVTCTATDAAGNTATARFDVLVRDTTPPALRDLPADVRRVSATEDGTVVTFTPPAATDLVDGAVNATCDPPSGTRFAIGATTVTCTARDGAGNAATSTFVVTVERGRAPVLTVPGDLIVEATNPLGATVTYAATATSEDPPTTLGCDPASGSPFPLGVTTVRCSARTAQGVRTEASFRVTVQDTTAPELRLPGEEVTVQTDDPSGAPVDFSVTATDAVDGSSAVFCSPVATSRFEVGTSRVECRARDRAGNVRTGGFDVRVVLRPAEAPAPAPGPQLPALPLPAPLPVVTGSSIDTRAAALDEARRRLVALILDVRGSGRDRLRGALRRDLSIALVLGTGAGEQGRLGCKLLLEFSRDVQASSRRARLGRARARRWAGEARRIRRIGGCGA
jgi:hypothetical protein